MIFEIFVKLGFGVELDQVCDNPAKDLEPFVEAFNNLI
jgi:hypothetical protein